jgi:hypothetical protein
MMRLFGVLTLALIAGHASAQDDGLRVPANMMLCHTLQAAASAGHEGCWLAHGGQRVEIVAPLPTYSQLRLWSTDGSEATVVYALRADADRLQQRREASK